MYTSLWPPHAAKPDFGWHPQGPRAPTKTLLANSENFVAEPQTLCLLNIEILMQTKQFKRVSGEIWHFKISRP